MLKNRVRFPSAWVVLESTLCGVCLGLWAAIAVNAMA